MVRTWSTGESPFPNSLEAAQKNNAQAREIAEHNKKLEDMKTGFNNLDDVVVLSISLEGIVDADIKENILWRLLLKYEKSPDEFNFSEALHKVFYWENIGGMRSSGINIEDKDDIYKDIINGNTEVLSDQKSTEETIEDKSDENTNEAEDDSSESLDNIEETYPITEESETNDINSTSFTDNPHFPLINIYVKNWDILPTDLDAIENAFLSNGKDMLEAVGSSLWKEGQEIVSNIERMESVEDAENRKADFYKDVWVEEKDKEDFLTNLVWENYLRVTDKQGNIDKEMSLEVTFQIAANKIKDWKKTIKKTEAFEDAEKLIFEGWSREEMYHALSVIHKWVNDSEGIHGKTKDGKAKRSNDTKMARNKNATEQFQEGQKIRLEAENNVNTNDPLLDKMYQAQEIKEEKIAETGAFWDVDKKFEGIQNSVSA